MLEPKKVKHRKQQKGRIRGLATRGCNLSFGDYGLQSLGAGRITARQIEAARIAINRVAKRGGKLWIRIFPYRSVSKKPAEVRMGKGKGSPEYWAAPIQRGRMLYEIKGVESEVAIKALTRASHKLPVKTKIVMREDYREAK